MNMAKTYYDKLKDPRWQKKRLEVFERDNFRCTQCGNSESMLAVHHGYYSKLDPWEYNINTLHTVCESCHEEYESIKHDIHLQIGKLSIKDMYRVFEFVRGMGEPINKKVPQKANVRSTVPIPVLPNLSKKYF